MKAIALLLVLISTVLGDCICGADETKAKISETTEWGQESGGCKIAIVTSKSSYHFDEPIHLTMHIKNVGKETAVFVQASLKSMVRFEVLLPKDSGVLLPEGSAAPLTLRGTEELVVGEPSTETSVIKLEPGKEFTEYYPSLNSLYDMSLLGEYTITASRFVHPNPMEPKRVKVSSNAIKIQVHAEIQEVK